MELGRIGQIESIDQHTAYKVMIVITSVLPIGRAALECRERACPRSPANIQTTSDLPMGSCILERMGIIADRSYTSKFSGAFGADIGL